MRCPYLVLLVIAAFTSSCLHRTDGNISRKSRAASAVSAEFETVFYSRSDLLTADASKAQQAWERNLLLPFSYLDLALGGISTDVYSRLLKESTAVLVGAKDFRPPQGMLGLGAVHSRKCYVIALKERSNFDLRSYVNLQPIPTLSGDMVWAWGVHIDEFEAGVVEKGMPVARLPKKTSIYAAQIGREYVIVSNGLQELEAIARQLRSSSQLPDRLLETVAAGRQYDIWGYRRYGNDGLVDRMASGMDDVVPGTLSAVCYLDRSERVLVLRLYVASVEGDQTAANLNRRKLLSPLRRSGKDIWQTSVSLADQRAGEESSVIVGLFGFIIYG